MNLYEIQCAQFWATVVAEESQIHRFQYSDEHPDGCPPPDDALIMIGKGRIAFCTACIKKIINAKKARRLGIRVIEGGGNG
jgi:hypothetical protein